MIITVKRRWVRVLGSETFHREKLAKAIFINNDGIGSDAELKAGVCRHIHQFAVRVSRQMGLKLSFGVTYPTSAGYHATMVVSDPKKIQEEPISLIIME